ncbi:FAD-dependent oxidoreductase [Streptomyces sp. NRRL WC-3742]|uniref:FAD-dependent oxidoreductase n=1 Tax=Streptomyces sp. NRRL WC-3742 TaxID=1463934 RepID=UPI0004CADC47|nr:FAD-dependent oxidoreductase [Streptomyces sp. NRRL WC-3742]
MAYAITRNCCNDASCVSVCPVNCIHPTPDEPEFGTTDMLYIDPVACIDCGACADACPVDAIFPVDRLRGPDTAFGPINRDWFRDHPSDHAWGAPSFPRSLPGGAGDAGPLRVAIVGTGPSAGYTAQELLRSTGAEITMIDRLPVTGGLLRHGVAPDHQSTKRIAESFANVFHDPRLRMHLNVEVGTDVTHEELAAHHHAVVYAVGAAADRRLDIPGEDLPGSLPATTFVRWYNAEPTVPAGAVRLDAERVAVIGTGNVAVDIARILLTDPDRLAGTDIADHALAALRGGRVREVVLLARRGPEQAAWTRAEFLALRELPGVELVVEDHPRVRAVIESAAPGSRAALLAGLPFVPYGADAEPAAGRRIVLRFLSAPVELVAGADGRVAGVTVERTAPADGVGDGRGEGAGEGTGDGRGEAAPGDGPVGPVAGTGERETLAAGLVVRSIGHRGVPVPGLPFDEAAATVAHEGGRVVDPATGRPLPGAYVVGWAKRGPSGGIGANRACARETVDALLDDAGARALSTPAGSRRDFEKLVRTRRPDAVGLRELRAVERAERARGEAEGRPRVKLATVPELLAAGRRR